MENGCLGELGAHDPPLGWLLLADGRDASVLLCFQLCYLSPALDMLLLADLVLDTTFMWELLMFLLLTPLLQLTAGPQTPMLLVQHEFLLAAAGVLVKPGSGSWVRPP